MKPRKPDFAEIVGNVMQQLREEQGISIEEAEAEFENVHNDPEQRRRTRDLIRCLGTVVQRVRTGANLTQIQVAERGKFSVKYLEDLEANKLDDFDLELLFRLGVGLYVSAVTLFNRAEELLGQSVPQRKSSKRLSGLHDYPMKTRF